jgi:rhamnulokinase
VDYATLTEGARRSAYPGVFDVTDARLLAPENMVDTIHDLLVASGYPCPGTQGDTVRACLASLAHSYAGTLRTLERLTNQAIDTIHIVGGGSKNTLLNQLTADACGVRVIAGPAEATAIGNLLAQLIGLGEIADLPQAREVVRHSFAYELVEYTPRTADRI